MKRAGLVWTRPGPARQPLNRDRIVATALAVADAEGLAALSMRRLATELGAGAMSLYRHVQDKEELLDLMADEVYAEIALPAPASGSWDDNLRLIARQTRAAMRSHAWFAAVAVTRPPIGPNALAHLDSSLRALSGLGRSLVEVSRLLGTVTSFVTGVVAAELAEEDARRRDKLTEQQWQETFGPYIEEAMASGRYPMLAELARADTDPRSPDDQFEFGLECLIAGIAAKSGSARASRGRKAARPDKPRE